MSSPIARAPQRASERAPAAANGRSTAAAEGAYQARRLRFAAEAARLGARSRALSWARLVTGGTAVAAFLAMVTTASRDPTPWAIAGAAGLVVFVGLVVVHDRVIRRERRWQGLVTVQDEELARLDRRWEALPVPRAEAPAEHRGLARDLQLFGHGSLLHLLGGGASPPGRATLARWLVEPAPPDGIAGRQDAVAALAPALDLRHDLALEGARLAALAPDVEPFLAWAEGDPWLLRRPWLLWAARLLPAAGWAAAAGAWLGPVPTAVPMGLFGACLLLANLLAGRLEEGHQRVAAREREMGSYATALGLLFSPLADAVEERVRERLRAGLGERGTPAHEHLARLQRHLDLADARRSGSLRFVLDTLFLWEMHTLWLLERWQVGPGRQVRGWLASLGELDALAALAGLRYGEPAWSFPRLDREADGFAAAALGHPLLPADRRVANDVTIGPRGTVLLVTGSNMAGKSTLLRAVGLNAVLAQAGGPVCAASLVLPPLDLATSVLVEDSLTEGLSFFMAEVLRVRDVVAAAERGHARGRPVLYLLDEILRGTNSADRRVAVREVLARLLELGAIGAVSTHDLALAEEQVLAAALVPVHFRETLHPGAAPGEPAMSFDYLLRPGIAPTANALQLMAMFGLAPRGD
jgi:hypothetical protein